MDPVPESAENRVRERGAASRFDCLPIQKSKKDARENPRIRGSGPRRGLQNLPTDEEVEESPIILWFEEVVTGVVKRTVQLTKELK